MVHIYRDIERIQNVIINKIKLDIFNSDLILINANYILKVLLLLGKCSFFYLA